MKNILVPIDFSPVSTDALKYAIRLAAKMNYKLVLLHSHVVHATTYYLSEQMMNALLAGKLDNVLKQMKEFVESLDWDDKFVLRDVEIDYKLEIGFPIQTILDVAENIEAEMIIIGSTGASNTVDQWLGSISSSIMEKANCPVLVIPPKTRFKAVKHIAYATEFIQLKKSSIDFLKKMANFLKGQLSFVHVNTEYHSKTQSSPAMYSFEKEHQDDIMFKTSSAKSVPIHIVRNENMVDGLYKYIDEEDVDILVMSTHQRSLWERITNQGETRKIFYRQLELPLLVFHKKKDND